MTNFTEAQRSQTTFKEHVMYFANISDWSVQNGLGAFARKAEAGDTVRFGPIAPVYKADGSIRVMPAQVLFSYLPARASWTGHGVEECP